MEKIHTIPTKIIHHTQSITLLPQLHVRLGDVSQG